MDVGNFSNVKWHVELLAAGSTEAQGPHAVDNPPTQSLLADKISRCLYKKVANFRDKNIEAQWTEIAELINKKFHTNYSDQNCKEQFTKIRTKYEPAWEDEERNSLKNIISLYTHNNRVEWKEVKKAYRAWSEANGYPKRRLFNLRYLHRVPTKGKPRKNSFTRTQTIPWTLKQRDLLEKIKLLGLSWRELTKKYNIEAKEEHLPERTKNSLKGYWENYLKSNAKRPVTSKRQIWTSDQDSLLEKVVGECKPFTWDLVISEYNKQAGEKNLPQRTEKALMSHWEVLQRNAKKQTSETDQRETLDNITTANQTINLDPPILSDQDVGFDYLQFLV